MYRTPRRIRRDYNRSFFSKRRNYARLYFVVFMLLLIAGIPFLAFWQFDRLSLAALDVVGMAPTATPFASNYATRALDVYTSGDVQGAGDLMEQAVRLQPENINYLYEYGRLLIELDRSDEAANLGDQIIALDNSDPRGYALKANALVWNDPAAAIPVAITGAELGDEPYAPLDAALAIAYTNIGRYAEALQRGDRAVRVDPQNASARRAYSYPLIFTGNYTEAIRQLEQAIAINPNLTGPYFELASLYRRLDQEEMAVSIYNRVLDIDPINERAYLRLCETYAAVGRFQEAQFYCEDALDIDPLYASAHRMLGQLQYSRRNYESSIESFETCVALGSEEIECYYIRGLAHYYLGQCDQAWDVLTESLSRAQQQPIVDAISSGLRFVTSNCAGYQGQSLPTPIPPTPIPPTPIGGGY
jgi:tetratricopeptide (TPR) repeat protein